ITLPAPVSTPFPYTTLFRSGLGGRVPSPGKYVIRSRRRGPNASPVRENVRFAGRMTEPRQIGGQQPAIPDKGYCPPIWRGSVIQDRKSTRLNSSHVSISYAV